MISQLKQLGQDFISIVYPPHCIECGCQIHAENKVFCIECFAKVGFSDHFEIEDNDLLKRISPRIDPEKGAALLNYIKDGVVQRAIHKLKYSQRFDIGIYLGKLYGESYKNASHFPKADYIIPIPIHRSRLRKRTYNQSFVFAKGISKVTGIPIDTQVLLKNMPLISQTQKGRADRFENVLSSFFIKEKKHLHNKRILLVDDVLTTGATIEAAYCLLGDIPGIKIQLGLIALANN